MSNKYLGLPVFNIDHLKSYKASPKCWENHTKLPETRTEEE